jgi:hypothetical protein
MSLERGAMRLLSRLLPPKQHPDVSPELLRLHEPKFKRYYIWHTVLGIFFLFGIPALTYFGSNILEKILYPSNSAALFVLLPEQGVVGMAVGMMLGFGLAMPLAMYVLRQFIEAEMIFLYQVWYEKHPNHPVNSELLSRIFAWIFIPLALMVALYFRSDCTLVTQEHLIRSRYFGFGKETLPLVDISSIEMQYGDVAPNGNYLSGFRYRFRFKSSQPWESAFFDDSLNPSHEKCRLMVEYVARKTGLEIQDVETTQ